MRARTIYDRDLDVLLDIAKTEYQILSTHDEALQSGLVKTYLWISTVILAALLAVGHTMMQERAFLFLFSGHCGPMFYALWGASLIFAGIVFVYGIDALRGRKALSSIGNFKNMYEIGEQAFQKGNEQGFRSAALRFLDRAVTERNHIINRKGRHLRIMSWLLLSSSLSAVLSVVAFAWG